MYKINIITIYIILIAIITYIIIYKKLVEYCSLIL